jgi:hypothetical protein
MVEIGESIRGYPLRFGLRFILDVRQDGDLPIAFQTPTGRFLLPALVRFGHFLLL